MSFKDDFVEALRSVKRDFFHDYDYSDQERQALTAQRQPTAQPIASTVDSEIESKNDPAEEYIPAPASKDTLQQPDHGVRGVVVDDEDDDIDDEDDSDVAAPYRDYGASSGHGASVYNAEIVSTPKPTEVYGRGYGNRRAFDDFADNGVYDDDQTIISKNTVIRGALQTEDSVRLLGQIMGDIDCKANVVVAGKVRGNTSAANAYVFDAQIDGDVRCDDVITISSDAWVLGNIRAQQAEIDGKVKGNMEIRHVVSIGASSSILGDISTDELEIKRGAFVNGQIMMYSPARDVLDRFDRFDE